MAKTKKSDNLEYCRGIRVMDVAVYVFALLAFGVYPLIYDCLLYTSDAADE